MFLSACHVFFLAYGHLRQPERSRSYSSISLLAIKKFLAHPSRRSFYSICRAVVNLSCFALSLKFNSCFHVKLSVMELKKIVMKLWDLGSETQVFHRSFLIFDRLNPVIRGWTHYYANVCSKATFAQLGHLLYCQLRAWACRRHPNKSRQWQARRYWLFNPGKRWTFAHRFGQTLTTLYYHTHTLH